MKLTCPHCHEKSIPVVKVAYSSRRDSFSCPGCGKNSKLKTTWREIISAFLILIPSVFFIFKNLNEKKTAFLGLGVMALLMLAQKYFFADLERVEDMAVPVKKNPLVGILLVALVAWITFFFANR